MLYLVSSALAIHLPVIIANVNVFSRRYDSMIMYDFFPDQPFGKVYKGCEVVRFHVFRYVCSDSLTKD